MSNKKYCLRAILTFLCALLAFCSFYFPPSPQTITVEISAEKTISTTHYSGSKFFEWVGILFLSLCVWIWHHELGLSGFGLFSGALPKQQTPEEYRKRQTGEFDFPHDVTSAISQMQEKEFEASKQKILELFRDQRALNLSSVARELRISRQTAKALLFALIKEGKVRCDGFPRSALYTLASSPDNLAIDRVRELIETQHEIRSERRFVKIKNRFEIDSIIEAERITFIVEVKYVKETLDISRLTYWLRTLFKIGQEFEDKQVVCYLALVVFDKALLESVERQAKQITYDTTVVDTRILVLFEAEIREHVHK